LVPAGIRNVDVNAEPTVKALPCGAPSQASWIRSRFPKFEPFTVIDPPGAAVPAAVNVAVAADVARNGTTSSAARITIESVAGQSAETRFGERRRWFGSDPSDCATQRDPSQNMAGILYGNPADSVSPVALRHRLATVVL
jgi:hypothetical protein